MVSCCSHDMDDSLVPLLTFFPLLSCSSKAQKPCELLAKSHMSKYIWSHWFGHSRTDLRDLAAHLPEVYRIQPGTEALVGGTLVLRICLRVFYSFTSLKQRLASINYAQKSPQNLLKPQTAGPTPEEADPMMCLGLRSHIFSICPKCLLYIFRNSEKADWCGTVAVVALYQLQPLSS